MTTGKGTVFCFTRKSSFLWIFEEFRMNEWKICFFSRVVFFPRPKIWMNAWLVNFSRKKKIKENTQKFRKKKHNQLLLKKKMEFIKNPNEWPMNFSWEKKNKFVFFFTVCPASREKKTRFSDLNEWMTNVHAQVKKYDSFATGEQLNLLLCVKCSTEELV